MKTIAFSWPWNTGKSTAIDTIAEQKRIQWHNVIVLWEIARDAFSAVNPEDMSMFQRKIYYAEEQRINEILRMQEQEVCDILLVDRTWADQLAYLIFNLMRGKILTPVPVQSMATDIYDGVIVLDTPIKQNTREEFLQYNNQELNDMIVGNAKRFFWEKAYLHSNAKDDMVWIRRSVGEILNE